LPVVQTRESLQAITVEKGQIFHNKWGKYRHDDMIGRKYGSKVRRNQLDIE
jgi:tRNA (adenine57-N1/adenine58-N1)-methyltransferase